ncbi:hypothetical protein [Actibacterium sp.]|jgi:hypothetical protein|uniref:hypothetical protein n=1 Tax=Actibacterium sp. TaxID=1872125 RepID=UPI002579C7AE|nr:hypothetical protein [Actibacterium sp.]
MIADLSRNRTVMRMSASPAAITSALFILLLILLALFGPMAFGHADPLEISAKTLAPPDLRSPWVRMNLAAMCFSILSMGRGFRSMSGFPRPLPQPSLAS